MDCSCYQPLHFFFWILCSNYTKQYTATAIFEIEQGKSNNLNIPSEFGALASLAGFGSVGAQI